MMTKGNFEKVIENNDPLKDAEDAVKVVDSITQKEASKVFRRYPISMTLLSLFGFAAVLNGFDGLIENSSYFSRRPHLVLLLGLLLLLITGTLFKWLQNREINL